MANEHHDADAKVYGSNTTVHDNIALKQIDCTTNGFVSGPIGSSENEEESKPQEVEGNQPNVPYIYRQDVVRCLKDGGLIGVVTEVAGDSDSDSSISDDDDDDDDDGSGDDGGDDGDDGGNGNVSGSSNENGSGVDNCKNDPLPADQVRVIWMDHSETTHNRSDVTVVDRGFLHGDIVAAVSDPTGQVGVVVDVNIYVDLLSSNGSIIKDVSSRDLKRVRDFTVGDYVVLGPWLGRIDDVLDNVTVLFDDGSMCKVMKADPLRLKPVSKNILEDGHFPYYPGQRVKASSSSVFKNARWLSGLWKANRLEGTVTKVTVGSVFIYWIASAGYGSESSTAPAEEQSPKNLILLSCFAHANWQLGDWCLFPSLALSNSIPVDNMSVQSSESMDLDTVPNLDGDNGNAESNTLLESRSCSSSLLLSKEPVHEILPVHRKKIRKVVLRRDKKARKKGENFERALVIVNTKTRVDVAWQDGKTELRLDSKNLVPIDSPGDHEFVAEQYVVEKALNDSDDACEVRRVGVVKSVNAKERTACVRWLKPVARPEDSREFDKEEVVSVYELEGHPDYDYCYGDVVVRLSPVFVSGNTATFGSSVEDRKQLGGTDEAERDLNKRSGFKKAEDASNGEPDLSWVGSITGLKDGDIEVTWADGMVSTVGPQAVYVVGRDDDDESIGAESEITDDAASWETVNEDEMDVFENAEEEAGLHNATDINPEVGESTIVHSKENNSGQNGPLSIPLAAFEFVTRLATGLLSRGRKQIDSLCSESRNENENESRGMINASERRADSDKSSSQESNVIDSFVSQTTIGNGDEHGLLAEATDVLDMAENSCNLRPEAPDAQACDVDDPCSFKRFDVAKDPLDHHFLGANGQNNNGRKWLKKVQQDWSILQNHLPDGIYVRVYEDRMDLLRAVMVGAYGTPYQDGLFVFDFHLPPEYPHVPPSAYYHSGGWRINPNLYEEGKVCLSLLNTWTGRGNEVWDPSSSSILQVLVSLQGLVLNSKPYFNEAGYDRQIGTAEGEKNSLSYNENTFLLSCKSMMYLLRKPPKDFEELLKDHFRRRGYYILKACDAYMKGYLIGSLTKDASVSDRSSENSTSVGFKLMLAKIVPKLILALSEVGADCREFKHLLESS
ncbi:hypothetical protein HHK36_031169 [Tetracentron sinense]|uniref:E2 ubiquitin-conjugating enzyme n=1 Tax=Tetracentron sinense TaxID=13715 RepID=A0A834YE49_TETSI|nr:hypothetical protein HHK36_031169 [Tetracentron sinense]